MLHKSNIETCLGDDESSMNGLANP